MTTGEVKVVEVAVGPLAEEQRVLCALTLNTGHLVQMSLPNDGALNLARTIVEAVNASSEQKWEVGVATDPNRAQPVASTPEQTAIAPVFPLHAEPIAPAIEVATAAGGRVRIPGSISPDLATAVIKALGNS